MTLAHGVALLCAFIAGAECAGAVWLISIRDTRGAIGSLSVGVALALLSIAGTI